MVTKPAPHFVIGPLVTGALGTAFTVKVTGALVVVHPETGSVAVAVWFVVVAGLTDVIAVVAPPGVHCQLYNPVLLVNVRMKVAFALALWLPKVPVGVVQKLRFGSEVLLPY
jgi:hypothetical protein